MTDELSDIISEADQSRFWDQVRWCATQRFSQSPERVEQYRSLNDSSITDVAVWAYCEHPMNIAADISGVENVSESDWLAYDEMFSSSSRGLDNAPTALAVLPSGNQLPAYASRHVPHHGAYRYIDVRSTGVLRRRIAYDLQASEDLEKSKVVFEVRKLEHLALTSRRHGFSSLVGALFTGIVVGISIAGLLYLL